MNRFKNNLSILNWEPLFSFNDTDLAFDYFWDIFNTVFLLHFPEITKTFNKNFHKIQPFMTEGLLTSRLNKNKLHLSLINNPTRENELIYKRYRNIYNTLVRQSKKNHFTAKIENSKNDPKKLWKTLNETLNRKQSNISNIDYIIDKNEKIYESTKMANSFNDFFANIANEIKQTIPATSTRPDSYLQDRFDLNFDFTPCDTASIIDAIKSLESKNTLDIDNISSKLLKFVAAEIAQLLAFIFKLSLTSGRVPRRLK